MIRLGAGGRALAVSLSFLAGFVDAVGFIETGRLFVSFMSGNSTQFGVGLAQGAAVAGSSGLVVGTFVVGVTAGSTLARLAGRSGRAAVLAFVAMLVGAAALSGALGVRALAIGLLPFAMGAENAVFEEHGEVRIGLTYMTGALVKVGQHVAGALAGGPSWAWLPHLLLWLGLVGGAAAGAALHPILGLSALWLPAGFAALLAAGQAIAVSRARS